MTYELLIALCTFALVSLISPGPNNLMLMASGMNYGWSRSLPHMLGIMLGFPFMILLVGLGIMRLFEAIPYSFATLKILSIGYLLYLAWTIATTAKTDTESGPSNTTGPLSFFQAAAFQWVNPKPWAMALTAVTAYAPEGRSVFNILIVALIFTFIGCFTINSWTLLGQQMRHLLRSTRAHRIFNISCALALVGSLYPIFMDGTQ